MTNAQQQKICGVNEHMTVLHQQDPNLQSRMDAIEVFTQNVLNSNLTERAVNGVITIPVVVHVLWNENNPQENISEAQILSQIDVLNEDYRRLNADASETLLQFKPVAADFELEFCLASVDLDGNPTNGIDRRSSSVVAWGYGITMKHFETGGLDAWPMDSYLNMWSCNIGAGFLGFATFPGGSPEDDGVVVGSNFFGSKDYDINNDFYLSEPYHLGRIMTHEVGHWINLRHIWGDGACNEDDFVDDTPRSNDPNWGCPINHVACGSIDMVQNYMDYSDDACANLLTQGQKARARAIFEPGGFRAAMLNSQGCGEPVPVCLPPSGIFATVEDNSAVIDFNGAVFGDSHDLELAIWDGPFNLIESIVDPLVGESSHFSYTLEGLETCTEYTIRISSSCSEPGGYETSPIYTFTTTGPECIPPTCDTPENQYARNITFTQATLGWDAVDAASEYKVQGRLSGGFGFIVVTRIIQSNSFRTNNLFPFLTYEYRVQTICDGLPNSTYSGWFPFTLNPFAYNDDIIPEDANLEEVDLFDTDHIINTYPNPSRGLVNVNYLGPDLDNVKMLVSDVTGKQLQEYNMDLIQNGTWQYGLSGLQKGLYLLSFKKDGILLSTEKLLIMK